MNPIQYYRGHNQLNETKIRNKKIVSTGRCNTVFIFRYVHICKNPKSSRKILLKLKEFDMFLGYKELLKINIYFYMLAITNCLFNTIIIKMFAGFL